jgi:hypothetical protein
MKSPPPLTVREIVRRTTIRCLWLCLGYLIGCGALWFMGVESFPHHLALPFLLVIPVVAAALDIGKLSEKD